MNKLRVGILGSLLAVAAIAYAADSVVPSRLRVLSLGVNQVAPSTTGAIYTNTLRSSSASPNVELYETDSGADAKLWRLESFGSQFKLRTRTDAGGAGVDVISATRSGTAVSNLDLTATALTFNGNITGTNLFTQSQSGATAPIIMTSNAPGFQLNEEDAASGSQRWLFFANLAGFSARTALDDGSASVSWLSVGRTGTTVNSIALTSTALTWNGDPVASVTTGSFTMTLAGMTAGTTGTVNYSCGAGLCTLFANSAITGTSNTTAMTLSGVPAAARSANLRSVPGGNIEDNGQTNRAANYGVNTDGTIVVGILDQATARYNSTGFTASGIKGLPTGWTITYPIG